MPELIAPTQSSFIKGRGTQDNILVIQELLHSLRNKKKNKVGSMILKLDLEKAYDKISWSFLEESLHAFNFPKNIIKLIMFCVSNASTKILWNGSPLDAFKHGCGLRQGDPLSPYLFVLCIERLSYLILEAVQDKKWEPIIPCRGGPKLSHLFFADDLIIMGKATLRTARTIKAVLDSFCGCSGLKLSREKSKVFFAKPGEWNLKRRICSILGFAQTQQLGKYLGANLFHGRVRREDFTDIFDKLSARYSGWKSRTLSLAGRATLVQSVATAVPIHVMQSCYLPENVCKSLDKLNRAFLWSNDPSIRKLHLVGWSKVTRERQFGGLGIRIACINNQALLAKYGWNLLAKEKGLWGVFVMAKYLNNDRLLEYKSKVSDSPTWKGLIRCMNLLKGLMGWKVGRGDSISFWFDNWLGSTRICDHVEEIEDQELELKLCDVIDNFGNWNLTHILTTLPQQVLDLIMDRTPTLSDEEDRIIWSETTNGVYTCQSAYKALYRLSQGRSNRLSRANWIWSAPCNNKIRYFLWLANQNRLASNHLRRTRKIIELATCESCKHPDETSLHILRHCLSAFKVWRTLLEGREWQAFHDLDDAIWMKKNLQCSEAVCSIMPNVPWNVIFAASTWTIWKARNNRIFKRKADKNCALISQIKGLSYDMFKACGKKEETRPTWQKPEEGWVKLNVDGGVDTTINKGAIGGVLRNEKGDWLWGFHATLSSPTILEAEVEPIRKGLSLAWERRLERICVETDSLDAYKRIMGERDQEPALGQKNKRMPRIHP